VCGFKGFCVRRSCRYFEFFCGVEVGVCCGKIVRILSSFLLLCYVRAV
jgi:hypothetical protein